MSSSQSGRREREARRGRVTVEVDERRGELVGEEEHAIVEHERSLHSA
jgi:hypothetical protein